MTNEERWYIIKVVSQIPLKKFNGTIEDSFRLYDLPSGVTEEDDDFLEKLYEAHVQVIGECFTCFGKDEPMRLIKMSETSIRIICDPCRENLHSAGSN